MVRIEELDTPAVVVDLDILERNIREMAEFAGQHGVQLRPHIKAHKSPAVAQLQMAAGATGITTAKLSEAEAFADQGFDDIFIAYPIMGAAKIDRLMALARRVRVRTLVDSFEAAASLSAAAVSHGIRLSVHIKVDSGLHRCGLPPGEPVVALARRLAGLPGLQFDGITTHAGQAYGASSVAEREAIGRSEADVMVETARLLKAASIPVGQVSVGSTPTVFISGQVPGVTEIRPGNYVFYDATQVSLGVVPAERCALRVRTRVISRPAPDRAVIDAGAKTLALDRGAHGNDALKGHGIIVGYPGCTLARLSEEHGVMTLPEQGPSPALGEVIELIPNHACTVVNLAHHLNIVRSGIVVDKWPVHARGCVW